MKLKDLASILYSTTGNIQFAVLYNWEHNKDVDEGSIDYLVSHYPEQTVRRITAEGGKLIITV